MIALSEKECNYDLLSGLQAVITRKGRYNITISYNDNSIMGIGIKSYNNLPKLYNSIYPNPTTNCIYKSLVNAIKSNFKGYCLRVTSNISEVQNRLSIDSKNTYIDILLRIQLRNYNTRQTDVIIFYISSEDS